MKTLYYKLLDIPIWFISKWYAFKRACAYFIFGWNTHDFDSEYVYRVLLFYYKRLRDVINNGYHEPCRTTNKSLNLTIRLLEKLANEEGYCKYLLRASEKNLQGKDLLEQYERDVRLRDRDRKLLFSIIEKYMGYWWE